MDMLCVSDCACGKVHAHASAITVSTGGSIPGVNTWGRAPLMLRSLTAGSQAGGGCVCVLAGTDSIAFFFFFFKEQL